MAVRRGGKTALVLASGGLTGVAYEVGALRALDHILTNRTVNDFDIYVGTSAGAVVAASLANGMPPIMLAGLLAGTVPGYDRLSRWSLYRPNVGELIQRLGGAPSLVRDAAMEFWHYRDRVPITEALYALAPLLPSGLFTNDGLVDYLVATFKTAGLSDDFRDIDKELHIIAADLETDKRFDFSRATTPNVPVSQAVAASTCIPLLFRPVEIDGRHYVDGGLKSHGAVDVAVNSGAKLIVIVNGVVPVDTAAIAKRTGINHPQRSIFELGIRAVGNQVLRGMLHDNLLDHIKGLRSSHPEVDFLLIEPRPDDEKMFYHEVMSFSAQMIVLQHGYETVAGGLYKTWPYLSRILPKHGIEITRGVVDSKPLEVPVGAMEEHGNLLGRLFQTVLDRRSSDGERPDITARVSTQTATTPRKPAAKATAAKKVAAAGGRPSPVRRRGNFRPRVISSE